MRRDKNPPHALTPHLATFATAVISLLIVITPWFFGGIESRVQEWAFLAVFVALLLSWLFWTMGRSSAVSLPIAIVPLVLAISFGVFQLTPLPDALHEAVSPKTAELWGKLLPSLDFSQDEVGLGVRRSGVVSSQPLISQTSLDYSLGSPAAPETHTISLAPASTRHTLALLVLATAIFLFGATLFIRSRAIQWLLGLVAVNGAALAIFGLIQQSTWNGKLFWSVDLTQGGTPFASFVNRNNAAGYLNLCLAAAVGLLVWSLARGQFWRSPSEPRSLGRRLSDMVSQLNTRTLLALVLCGCILSGVLCSLSRGGWLATACAAILVLLCVAMSRHFESRFTWIMVAALLGIGIVGWLGRTEVIRNRLSTMLSYEQNIANDRIGHWQDTLRTIPDFWLAGSGLGTYRYIYLPYQRQADDSWYYHAENQYLETAVETGIVGLLLLAVMILLVGGACWRLLREAPNSINYALGIAGTFALASQVVHACFDFGLYLPANMLLFALLCGLVTGRAALLESGANRERETTKRPLSSHLLWGRGGKHVVPSMAAVLALLVWMAYTQSRSITRYEDVRDRVRAAMESDSVSLAQLQGFIGDTGRAAANRPDSVETQRLLGNLWIDLYELEKREELRERSGARASDAVIARMSSLPYLHGLSQQMASTKRLTDLENLRSEPLVRRDLVKARNHLLLSRRACPLYADVHLRLAELCFLEGDPGRDWIHLERARMLAPSNGQVLFYIGLLEIQAGRPDMACDTWRQCLEASPGYLPQILPFASNYLNLAEQVDRLLPDSPALLVQVARKHFQGEEHTIVRNRVLRKAERLMRSLPLTEANMQYLEGAIFACNGQTLDAIQSMARAVDLQPQNSRWRYDLALQMRKRGMSQQAREQAQLCLRLDPENDQYKDLLRQLIRDRLTAEVDIRQPGSEL